MRIRLAFIAILLILALASCHAPRTGAERLTTSGLWGTYQWSGGRAGGSLTLAPNGRYREVGGGCLGWHAEEGVYDVRDGWVRLWCDTDERWLSRRSFRVVPWGERTYLVDEWGGERFCDEVNLGSEPRAPGLQGGFAYLRDGDEAVPVQGFPDVPAEWKGFLVERPVEGKVTVVRANGSAVIDMGRADGLRERMHLLAWPGDRLFGLPMLVRVESADEDTAVIQDTAVQSVSSVWPSLEVGDRVSSRRDRLDGRSGDAQR